MRHNLQDTSVRMDFFTATLGFASAALPTTVMLPYRNDTVRSRVLVPDTTSNRLLIADTHVRQRWRSRFGPHHVSQ